MAQRKADEAAFFPAIGFSRNDPSLATVLRRKKQQTSKDDNESDSKKFIDDRMRYEASVPVDPPLIPRRIFVITAVIWAAVLAVLGGVGLCQLPNIGVDFEEAAILHEMIQNSSCGDSCIYAESRWSNCDTFCTAEGPGETERTLHVAYKPREAAEGCEDRKEILKCLHWKDFIKYEWSEWSPCLMANGQGKSFRKRNLPTEGYVFNLEGSTADDAKTFLEQRDCQLDHTVEGKNETKTTGKETSRTPTTTVVPIPTNQTLAIITNSTFLPPANDTSANATNSTIV